MDINKINYTCDKRDVIDDTLTRINKMLNEEKYIDKIVKSTQLPYIFTNSPIPLEFTYKIQESMLKETYCKCNWCLLNKEFDSPILLIFELAENTLEKNVLLSFGIKLITVELIPQVFLTKFQNNMPQICTEVINNIKKELQENNKDISHFESKVMNYPREKIWDIIANIHCFMNKNGIIKECTKQVPIKEKGEEFSFFLGQKCKKKLCKLNVNKFQKNPDSNKWVMGYLPLEGPFQHSENYWTLIKLGDNQTMVGNTTIYSEHVSPEDLKKLTETKNEMFNTIESLLKKEEFENEKCYCEDCLKKISNEQCGNK